MADGTGTRVAGSWVWRVMGVLPVAAAFVPLRRISGHLQGAGTLVSPGEWLLGLGIFAVTAWLVTVLASSVNAPDLSRLPALASVGSPSPWWATGLGVLAGLLVLTSWLVFSHTPSTVDSVAQLFHGQIFAAGHLVAPPPAHPEFFVTQNMVLDETGWYSQYPPGHPLMLAAGVLAGVPWVVPIVTTLGAAALLFLAVRRIWGPAEARLTLLLLVLSPFFWIMGASHMNHVSTLFLVSVVLYFFVRWTDEGGAGAALAAGAGLGAAATVRPLTALAVGVCFAVFAVRDLWSSGQRIQGMSRRGSARGGQGSRRPTARGTRDLVLAASGCAAVASTYLLYNAAVTGHPLVPGYLELWGGSHGLGFHETPWGETHAPLDGLRNQVLDLALLNLHLFEWPVPAMVPVGVAFLLGWMEERWERRLLVAGLALPAAYLFYWHRDALLGPRFLFASVAFFIPLTARAILETGRRLRDSSWQPGDLFRPVRLSTWAGVFLSLCVLYGVLYGAPGRVQAYASSNRSMKTDLRLEAMEEGIDRGLVFVKVSWGNRILSRMRGRGVTASAAIQAYRGVGHCRLHELLNRAESSGWGADSLSSAVRRARAETDSLVQTSELNGDPTLRLRPGAPLSRECREELEYDASGYTVFAPHIRANAPDLTGSLLVARDLRSRNPRLWARHPGRRAYLFDGADFEEMGDVSKGTSREPSGHEREAPGPGPLRARAGKHGSGGNP